MLTARENTLSMLNFLLSLSYFLYLSTSGNGGTLRGRAEELPSDREYTRSVEACAGIVYMKRRYPERAAVLHSMDRRRHVDVYTLWPCKVTCRVRLIANSYVRLVLVEIRMNRIVSG